MCGSLAKTKIFRSHFGPRQRPAGLIGCRASSARRQRESRCPMEDDDIFGEGDVDYTGAVAEPGGVVVAMPAREEEPGGVVVAVPGREEEPAAAPRLQRRRRRTKYEMQQARAVAVPTKYGKPSERTKEQHELLCARMREKRNKQTP